MFKSHTPAASLDYQQPEVTLLDILQRAEKRDLNIIAFTDHNTISGYARLRNEIEQLELLEKLGRLLPEESKKLARAHRQFEKENASVAWFLSLPLLSGFTSSVYFLLKKQCVSQACPS